MGEGIPNVRQQTRVGFSSLVQRSALAFSNVAPALELVAASCSCCGVCRISISRDVRRTSTYSNLAAPVSAVMGPRAFHVFPREL